jgi:hypothetical protein
MVARLMVAVVGGGRCGWSRWKSLGGWWPEWIVVRIDGGRCG